VNNNPDFSYQGVMSRKNRIMKQAVGIDYDQFELEGIAFDYDAMMNKAGYSLEEVRKIQEETNVGKTPLFEMHNLTKLVRLHAEPGKGARIFIKDEACNPSGSFKARRASLSCYQAQKQGYRGVISATSGNYGAAVASQSAMRGLNCIVVQELFDSQDLSQPEIMEKGRACEAYGAEVVQLSVGPELFYKFLILLEETQYFNASLYTPFGIAGIETLGYELAEQVRRTVGKDPAAVLITHAGGGNVTGTARGLQKAGCKDTDVIGISVDLSGLHMASDHDFNRKSFTTGHTGFGVPFATWPDRADVPRNAARSLRYLDRYYTVTQGEVFYMTELLAQLEGLERGPAGNTSLAGAFALAREMDRDDVIVVQETEYTGAGKHPSPQLTFARKLGIAVKRGKPEESIPGQNIIIPESPAQIAVKRVDLDNLKKSYLKKVAQEKGGGALSPVELDYLAAELKTSTGWVEKHYGKAGG